MPRCLKKDAGRRSPAGCVREAGHTGRCKVRPDPEAVYAQGGEVKADYPCATAGCERRVKTEGAHCPSCRGRLNPGRGGAGSSAGPGRRLAGRLGRIREAAFLIEREVAGIAADSEALGTAIEGQTEAIRRRFLDLRKGLIKSRRRILVLLKDWEAGGPEPARAADDPDDDDDDPA